MGDPNGGFGARADAAEGPREQGSERTWTCVSERPSGQRTDAPPQRRPEVLLLDLDFAADLFDGCLDLLCLVLGHAFLDGLRCGVDDVLGLLQAEPGQLAD